MIFSETDLVTQVAEVIVGSTAVLRCNSNDDHHNFLFWQLSQNKIIGPGNSYDKSKYKYEVLSGRLLIKGVTPDESGFYRCISKNLNTDTLNVGAINMVVRNNASYLSDDTGSDAEIIKIIVILISVIILAICGFLFYRMWKDNKKAKASKIAMFGEDDDEEGSGDEIYNRTTTVITDDPIRAPGPSKSSSDHITGIDNQGLDTDFNAAFEQIAINVANRNLI